MRVSCVPVRCQCLGRLRLISLLLLSSAERYERYAGGEKRHALRSGRRRHSSSPSSSSRRHRPKLNRRAKGDSYDSQVGVVVPAARAVPCEWRVPCEQAGRDA